MPSLDFIYDITEKLDEEEIDYLVLTIREGRTEDKVDAFFNIGPQSTKVFEASIEEIKELIATRENDKKTPLHKTKEETTQKKIKKIFLPTLKP